MKSVSLILAAGFTALLAAPALAADTVPCEKLLEDLRAAIKTVALSDADKAQVAELEDKGIERCNADDDARADAFFADALKIVSK